MPSDKITVVEADAKVSPPRPRGPEKRWDLHYALGPRWEFLNSFWSEKHLNDKIQGCGSQATCVVHYTLPKVPEEA